MSGAATMETLRFKCDVAAEKLDPEIGKGVRRLNEPYLAGTDRI